MPYRELQTPVEPIKHKKSLFCKLFGCNMDEPVFNLREVYPLMHFDDFMDENYSPVVCKKCHVAIKPSEYMKTSDGIDVFAFLCQIKHQRLMNPTEPTVIKI